MAVVGLKYFAAAPLVTEVDGSMPTYSAGAKIGHLMKAVFRFAGLGIADVVLGILFSVVKVGLILSVLFAWFDSVNKNYDWAPKEVVEQSRWYRPLTGVVDKVTPYFEQFSDKIFD